MKEEIWKDIAGYEGLYQVSNFGRIKSLERFRLSTRVRVAKLKERILVSVLGNHGYPYVGLSKNGKVKIKTIHRLVAIAFVPNPKNYAEVNHINGIKSDNNCENLEWCTPSGNILHSYKLGLQTKGRHKIVLNQQTGIFYSSAKEAAKAHDINYGTLKSKLSGNDNNNTSFIYA